MWCAPLVTPGATMTLSLLYSLLAFTPHLLTKTPFEAFADLAGVRTLRFTLVMSTKSAATGPLPDAPALVLLPPWLLPPP